MSSDQETLLRYLIEFRKRLIYALSGLVLISSPLLFFANDLYALLALPLLRYLPAGQQLIATQVVSPVFVPISLAFMVGLFLSIPLFLYQVWAFVAPALYQHERRLVWVLLLISSILFYLGVMFAYFIVLPILFRFLVNAAPLGVLVSPDIAAYFHFTLNFFFIFGLIFEVPVLTILLIRMGWVTREKLISFRPYIIVGAFILGMFLAPPDVISQTLLAIPMWLLFELGIFLAPFLLISNACRDIERNEHVR